MRANKPVEEGALDSSENAKRRWWTTRLLSLGRARYRNLLLLLLLGTLWGSSYLFIKVTVAEVPALTLVSVRLAVASIVLQLVLRARGHAMPRSGQMWRVYALLGLFGAAIPYSLISWGEQYISSGLASLLQATTPIFTVLLATFVTDEEGITPTKIAGVAIGFAGVGLLVLPDLRQGMRANLLGQLAIIGSSLCYAWTALYARSRLRGQRPLVSATGQLTMGAAFALPASLLVDRPFDLSPSHRALASWLGLIVFGTILAYGIYFTLIERTSATFATMVTYIIPVNGLILGALVLGEPLSAGVLGSLALILLGALLVRSERGGSDES
jgi:drug/metabolite transporter (DMT)-like permease